MSNFRPTLPPKEGFVEVEHEGARVYKRISDGRLFHASMTPVEQYSAKELREQMYETYKCIDYDGEQITVDEAEKLFWQYFPENKVDVCDELRRLIFEAKQMIREMCPDENEET